MIVKRKPRPVRAIVRRGTPTVGERRPRAIVRRGGGVVPPDDGGTKERGGWRMPRKWLWLGGALTIMLLLAGGAAYLYESPVFKVSKVQVVGADRTSPDTVVETADLLGDSMFTADLVQAQKDLYKLPLVSSVKVERSWPNTIKVTVEERQPWGTWHQGDVDYTIDREGVVLAVGSAGPNAPVISSSEAGSRRQGDRVDYQAVDAAAEIYEKLPGVLGTTVTEVSFVAGQGVQVTTANNQTALFGDSSSIAYKLAVWAALAQQARVQKINYTTVDLRFGDHPVLQ